MTANRDRGFTGILPSLEVSLRHGQIDPDQGGFEQAVDVFPPRVQELATDDEERRQVDLSGAIAFAGHGFALSHPGKRPPAQAVGRGDRRGRNGDVREVAIHGGGQASRS